MRRFAPADKLLKLHVHSSKAILQRATKKHNRNIINSMLNMLKQLITSSLEIGAERYPDVCSISLAEMLSNIMDCPLLG